MSDSMFSDELQGYVSSTPEAVTTFSWNTLFRILRILVVHKTLIVFGVISMIICVGASLLGPWILGRFVDQALVPKDTAIGLCLAGMYGLAEIVRIASSVAQSYCIGSAGEKVMHDLRFAICTKALQLPLSRLDKTSSGSLLSRATTDVAALSAMFSAGVLNILEKLVVVCSIVCAMFFLNSELAAVALLPFVPIVVVSIIISLGLHRAYVTTRRMVAAVTSYLIDSLSGIRIVRIFNAQATALNRFTWLSERLAKVQLRPAILSGALHPTMTIVTAVSMSILACYGSLLAKQGTLQVGILVTFFSYILWIFWPIMHAISQWNVIVAGLAAADRIFDFLDWPTEEDLTGVAPIALDQVRGEIEFRNVWFSYGAEDVWALEDVSFRITAGTTVGIVGATGSGKSTIIALLLRLYEPQRGQIFLDGVSLNKWPKRVVREALGVVRQDLMLFDGSVAENITLFQKPVPNLPANTIQELERRGLGFGVLVGKEGRELSSGERQLLSFCRTLSRRPRVWILDEATAHLDPWLDRELERLLKFHASGQTVVCVAHRLSSVSNADQIIVMSDGRVKEIGSHQQLIAHKGLYARYFGVQSRLQQGAIKQ